MLEFYFFGGFRLTRDGEPIDRPIRDRVQSLLALLILNAGRSLRREYIAELLWPEATPEQSLGSLRRLLFDLRNALPEVAALVDAARTSLSWPETGTWWSDVRELEALAARPVSVETVRAAGRLYRGDLLPACYEDWIVPERDRLRDLFLGLLEGGSVLAEEEGDVPTALASLRRLISEEPLREDIYRHLMRLQIEAGDPAAALATYHLCVSTLARELEVEPAEPTRALYESLLHAATASMPPRTTPIVGRDRELALLRSAWRRVMEGRSEVVTIAGEPGIGKTRLLEEVRRWSVGRGERALYARGYEAGGALPFATVVGLLRSAPLPDLEPAWRAELGLLLPELASDTPEDGIGADSWRRIRLFDAISRAVLGREPVLIVLDDAQWIDRDTLDWLQYFLRSHAESRALVVMASRPEGVAAGGGSAFNLGDLARDGRLTEIELGPLDREAATALAAGMSATLTPAAVVRLWEETAGNPLFIVETVRAGSPEQAAASILSILGLRLAGLSKHAQGMASNAAVIGRAFALPLLLAASPLEEAEALSALDELWRYRIVRLQGPESYDFAHDRMREAALNTLSPATLQVLHRRVAEALQRLHARDLDSVSAQIAAHLQAAGELAAAAAFHVRAGWAAVRVYSHRDALGHFRRSLELLPESDDLEALHGLAMMHFELGEYEEARQVAQRVIGLAAERGDQPREAQARYGLGVTLHRLHRHGEAIPLLEGVRDLFERLGDERGQARTLAHLGTAYALTGRPARALASLEACDRLALRCGDVRLRLFAANGLGLHYAERGEYGRAEEYQRRVLAEAEDPRARANARQALGVIAVETERYREALDLDGTALAEHAGLGDDAGMALDVLNLGVAYSALGLRESAERALAVAVHMSARRAMQIPVHVGEVFLGQVYLYDGCPAEAERFARVGVERLRHFPVPRLTFLAIAVLAAILEERGDCGGALDCARELHDLAAEMDREDFLFAAEVMCLRLGALPSAQALPRLRTLFEETGDLTRRARLHDALWQIDPTSNEDRQMAAALYRDLYTEREKYEYRLRYQTLTGKDLQPPPPFPPLPDFIRSYPGTTKSLLAEVAREPAPA